MNATTTVRPIAGTAAEIADARVELRAERNALEHVEGLLVEAVRVHGYDSEDALKALEVVERRRTFTRAAEQRLQRLLTPKQEINRAVAREAKAYRDNVRASDEWLLNHRHASLDEQWRCSCQYEETSDLTPLELLRASLVYGREVVARRRRESLEITGAVLALQGRLNDQDPKIRERAEYAISLLTQEAK